LRPTDGPRGTMLELPGGPGWCGGTDREAV